MIGAEIHNGGQRPGSNADMSGFQHSGTRGKP